MAYVLTVVDPRDDEILYQEVASSSSEARKLALTWFSNRYHGEYDDNLTGDIEGDYDWLVEFTGGVDDAPVFTIRETGS